MPILSDSHIHSHHSGDSSTPMAFQIESAMAKGLSDICFTEHLDMDFPYENTDMEAGTFDLDLEKYHKEFIEMQRLYQQKIHLRYGIELGLQPQISASLSDFVNHHREFDEIIGSTHVCDNMDPYYPIYFEGRSEEDAYRSYFITSSQNLEAFHDFDTYGHLDYIVRYGPHKDSNYSYEKYRHCIDDILEQLVTYGIALEVNTAGLAKGMRNFNPTPSIVKRYMDMGGHMITIGSDAHISDKIAFSFDTACEILKSIGVVEYTIFHKRKPVFYRL